MQIIAGIHKGRRLIPPKGAHLRPTAAKVREALFNLIGSRVIDAHVVDLFAGSGAVGIEAWSRGAAQVTFVEHHPVALSILRQNLSRCGASGGARVYPCNVWRFFRLAELATWDPVRVVFADPPYAMQGWDRLLTSIGQFLPLAADALVIVEHHRKTILPHDAGSLAQIRRIRYGDTAVTVFVPASAPVSALHREEGTP